ncbi:unnamed protein product [Ectocarpus sp. 8 AP-2014]
MDEAQCLYFLMGEDAKILGYGAVKSESEEELTLLFQRYADRRRKKGTLHALRWLHDDRCCRGCKDVTKYYGVQIFPHMERAPYADSFHATQNLAGATTSKSHERRGVYARGVGGSVRSKYKPDVDAVVEYFMRENKRMTRAGAERKAKSKSMSRYVRTVSRPIEETIAEVSKVVRLHARLDAEGRERGELALLQPELPPGKRGPRGAQAELNSLISCLRKGCGQDPLPVDKMVTAPKGNCTCLTIIFFPDPRTYHFLVCPVFLVYAMKSNRYSKYQRPVPVYLHVGTGKKTKLKRYVKKGGTAKNESFHHSLNAMTSSVLGSARATAISDCCDSFTASTLTKTASSAVQASTPLCGFGGSATSTTQRESASSPNLSRKRGPARMCSKRTWTPSRWVLSTPNV